MLLPARSRGATRLAAHLHTTTRLGITASAATPATTAGLALASKQKARLRIQERDAVAVSPHLIDSFGRQHDYLRISLTEKCNLRCTYCMPEQGVPLLPNDSRLTAAEIERVAAVFVRNGVRKIRLTGGEPTVRSDLVDIVERLGRLRELDSLGITSNGIALKRKLPALVDAGLTHLNLSLDTLDPFKYELMTRRRGFDRVVEVLDLAQRLGGGGQGNRPLRVKLNVVVIRGVNDGEVADFVALTREQNITVRFIEYMPFEDNRWSTRKLVPSADLLADIESKHPHLVKLRDSANDTTRAYAVPGWRGSFGFISSMTDHFCGTCSRLRIGPDGGVKVCLFGPPVLSLRPLLRGSSDLSAAISPATDDQLMEAVGRAVYGKKFAHNGLGATAASHRDSKIASRQYRTIPVHLLPTPPIRAATGFPTSRRAFSSSTRHRSDDRLTHIDPVTGKASMVSVSAKDATERSATATGEIYLGERAFSLIDLPTAEQDQPALRTQKGDVLSIAQIAGIMGSKHTALLIPLCHPLSLSHVAVSFRPVPDSHSLRIEATAQCVGPTGVEMEALTAVSVAALTVWDMCKAVAGQEMRIGEIKVVRKTGGKSGDWVRSEEDERPT